MRCYGGGQGPWNLVRAWMRGSGSLPAWPQFAGRRVIATYQARTAIALAWRMQGLKPGDAVLAPAYNCGTEIDPLVKSGATVTLYRVDRCAGVDVEDVKRRVTARTRVVYVTHYFGWPAPVAELAAWCRERGLLLWEDCALSLFSSAGGMPIGSAGDAAFFSFPKTLSVPDGGALSLAGSAAEMDRSTMRPPPLAKAVRGTLPLMKRRVWRWAESAGLNGAGTSQHMKATAGPQDATRPEMPANYFYDAQRTDWGMSRVAAGLLHKANPGDIVERRRKNYAGLQGELGDVRGVAALFDALPEGVCPLGYPVLVEGRRRWCEQLNAAGIEVSTWWEGYHPGVAWDGVDEACYLKDHLLLLPVHHELDERHMAYIAATVQALAVGAAR